MAESIRGDKSICLPVESETQYRGILFNPKAFRQYVIQIQGQYPELFPDSMEQGFWFHVFGRNPMYWYRIYLSLGRASIVGTRIKDLAILSRHERISSTLCTLDGTGVEFSSLFFKNLLIRL